MSSKGYALWRAGEALIAHEDRDRRTLALLKHLAEDRCGYCCPEPHCPSCGASPMVDGLPMPCLPDCELAALIRELS